MPTTNYLSDDQASRRNFLHGVGQAGLGVLAFSISTKALGLPSSASGKIPEKITIATLPFNTEVTAYLGDMGFLKEQGVTAELYKAAGGPAAVQALISGSVPVGDIGVGPALIAAIRGLPLLSPALGALGSKTYPFSRIMVRNDSDIMRLEDLKGKKLALHQRGTMEDLGLYALKKTHGIDVSEFQIVVVPAPNQPQALKQGLVDAIYAMPPTDTVAEQSYNARTLVNTADFIPYIGYGTLSMHRDFVDAYPEAAKRIMKVWIRLCRWIDDNREEARRVSNKSLGIDPQIGKDVRIPYFARNGLPVMPNVWHIYEMLTTGKVIDRYNDPSSIIDKTVIEPAKKITLPALDELGWSEDSVVSDMLQSSYPLLPKPTADYYASWERKLLKL
ncbi:ABC transporter substrate-binding protein [Eoetvoesiella caeni]